MSLVVHIRQHQFTITREYQAGHVCSADEAMALNQMMIEKVRNNVAPWVAKETAKSRILTAEQHSWLQQAINNYADKFRFKARAGYRPTAPLESATRELAGLEAETWGHQNGFAPRSPEVTAKFQELCDSPVMQDRARDLIRSRQLIAGDLIEDLGI